jgi:hypothetical protein
LGKQPNQNLQTRKQQAEIKKRSSEDLFAGIPARATNWTGNPTVANHRHSRRNNFHFSTNDHALDG